MIYQHEIPVASDPLNNCYLGIGEASWDRRTPVIKLGWRQANGHRSRLGGEFWMEAYLQGVTELVRLGYIRPKEALQAVIDGMP